MKTTAVFCFMVLLGLAVARSRGPCGCKPVFQFCANDYTTYHSICEYKCKHPSTPFHEWYILYHGACHSDYSEPDTTTKRSYAYATTEKTTTTKPSYAYATTTTEKTTTTKRSYAYTTTTTEKTTSEIAIVEWIPSSLSEAASLSHRAVVAGDDSDGSPLWVIRAQIYGEVIPGKYAAQRGEAYVPLGSYEEEIDRFEVCCAPPERIRWVRSRDGAVPPSAVLAGHTAAGDPLYVGRAKHEGSLTPGKVQPRDKILYITYLGREKQHNTYEVLCTI